MPPGELKSYGDDVLDADHIRELAEKCLRFASNMSDETTAETLRRMAEEYEILARDKEKRSQPREVSLVIL